MPTPVFSLAGEVVYERVRVRFAGHTAISLFRCFRSGN